MFHKTVIVILLVLVLALAACGGAAETPMPTLVEVTPLPTATEEPLPTPEPTITDPQPTEPPTAEPTATPPSAEELAEKIDAFLKKQTEANRFIGAALVARGDEIILSEGYGLADREEEIPNTSITRFRIGSLTKAFTALAIMQLQEQDKLNVDDPICGYIDDCPTAWDPVTIHHLLTHTSGIFNHTDLPDFRATDATPLAPSDAVQLVADQPLEFEPGSAWSYSNTGYLLLGLIIERVSGKTYETFLQENIFDPLGMADTGYDHNRDDLATGYTNQFREADYLDMSAPFAAGGLYSTVEDLFRWVRAVQSDELVSTDTRKLIFTQHMPVEPGADLGYGYGWFYSPLHDRLSWGHDGAINGFVSLIFFFPEEGVTSILLSNQEDITPGLIGEILTNWTLGIE
jgi:CubicO group peptidase (beta-lactamase class C family)